VQPWTLRILRKSHLERCGDVGTRRRARNASTRGDATHGRRTWRGSLRAGRPCRPGHRSLSES